MSSNFQTAYTINDYDTNNTYLNNYLNNNSEHFTQYTSSDYDKEGEVIITPTTDKDLLNLTNQQTGGNITPPSPPFIQNESTDFEPEEEESNSATWIIVGVVCTIVLLAGIGIVMYFIYRDKQSKKGDEEELLNEEQKGTNKGKKYGKGIKIPSDNVINDSMNAEVAQSTISNNEIDNLLKDCPVKLSEPIDII